MADAFTTRLRLEKPEVNANDGTWGTELNDNMIDMVDEAVAGVVSVSLTAGNVTLSTNNGTADQARNPVIILTGTPGATRTVTFPNVEGNHWVKNESDSTATLDASGGTTINLPSNVWVKIYTDGSAGIVALRYSFRGAMVKKSADQTAADYTGAAIMAFDAEVYDTGGWHDTVTNNSRLTVPAGVTAVRVGGTVSISSSTADTYKFLDIIKNGATFDGRPATSAEIGSTGVLLNVVSGVLAVSAGDYFEMRLIEESDNSVTIIAAETTFWIEAVQ